MAYTKYSLTPASNNAAPPDGAPEGMLPSAVNDTMRDMMSQIRDCGDGIRGGTYTMTAPVITGGSVTGVTFSSSSATITGGTITGVTDITVADGGTGASTVAAAQTNLQVFNFKNRIINGDMRIDQRNAGASSTPAVATYLVDRFQTEISVVSKFTYGQNLNSVTPPVGFSNYLGCQTASAYSVGATDYFLLEQKIEGFNTADLGWGTANAKTVTLSFWAYSSLTGTFGGNLQNNAANRFYPFSYSIPTANTWTQISITIAGDTTGTWVGATNGLGLMVRWSQGTGSTYLGTAGSWGSTVYLGVTGQQQQVGTASATFYITGVQLEVGSSATGFEYVDYTTQLTMCQRYYYKMVTGTNSSYANFGAGVISSTTLADRGFTPLPVNMRASPSFAYTTMRIFDGATAVAVSSISANYSTPMIGGWGLNCSGAVFVVGRAGILIEGNADTGNIQFSSEL